MSRHLQTTIRKYRVFKKVFRIDWNLKHSIVALWVNQAYFHSHFISPGNKLNELEPCAINSESYFLGTPCRDKNEEKFLRCIFDPIEKCPKSNTSDYNVLWFEILEDWHIP